MNELAEKQPWREAQAAPCPASPGAEVPGHDKAPWRLVADAARPGGRTAVAAGARGVRNHVSHFHRWEGARGRLERGTTPELGRW